jgi:[1-hydroxy-2-(trimethylamino)ethyl]phosphonate dioxygenase
MPLVIEEIGMIRLEVVEEIERLFSERGSSLYGGEDVTQLEHALQAAALAEASGADGATISAALLHDIGHLLHDLPDDAPDVGIDDVHEQLGYDWLKDHFGPAVTEPIRMHVDAKRYLCAVEPEYRDSLSPPSEQSLMLQGGPYNPDQVREFEQRPFFSQAVEVRRWDDLAKVPGLETPDLAHFMSYVGSLVSAKSAIEATP